MAPNERTRRATIRDVAARAGVSASTVSHVFSGRRTISEATRMRVLQTATDLDYRADPTAQSLRRSSTGILGLIVRPRDAIRGSLRGTQTFERLMGAVAAEVLERGLALIHVPDIFDPSVTQVPMDGCIVAHPYADDAVLAELQRRRVPTVLIEEDTAHPELAWAVALDYKPVLHRLLGQLRRAGAKRMLLLSGTEDNAWNRRPREIITGWAAEHGVQLHLEALYEGEGAVGAHRLLTTRFDEHGVPDAVITGPSTFAAGALSAVQARGLAVPGDVQIAALVDSEYTRGSVPPVTALDLVLEDLAAHGVDLLVQQLAGAPAPASARRVLPTLHARASTGRVAG